jgi:hypothetical protein
MHDGWMCVDASSVHPALIHKNENYVGRIVGASTRAPICFVPSTACPPKEHAMPTKECEKIPHSWELLDWPDQLWPHDGKQAVKKNDAGNTIPAVHPKVRWLIESKKTELMKAGALVRPGRVLVVLGPQYLGWLQRQLKRVGDFEDTSPSARAGRKASRESATA